MPLDNTSWSEVDEDTAALIRTKDLLVQKGWCVGALVNSSGQHCIIGALRASGVNTELQEIRVFRRLASFIEYDYGVSIDGMSRDGLSLVRFNNHQSSPDPVLYLLEKAIAQ